MITTLVLYIVYFFVWAITSPLRLLDNVTAPTILVNTVDTASGYLSMGYAWLPVTVTTLLLTWGLYLVFEVGIFTYKGIMWVIKKVPFVN